MLNKREGFGVILAFDIGNTTIAIGLLKGHKVLKVWRLETASDWERLQRPLKRVLHSIHRAYPYIEKVLVCSVVPHVSEAMKGFIERIFQIKPQMIGKDIHVPMINRYRKPRQVGQDRLVGAYAAKRAYGQPIVVIDFGTAVTFDVVSSKGEYLGGVIIPGLRLAAESLYKKTALLPKIKIKTPRTIIGRDTEGSILSGLFFGYGALCDGLIKAISRDMRRAPRVILTGGYSPWIKKFLKQKVHRIDGNLVLKGIGLLAEK